MVFERLDSPSSISRDLRAQSTEVEDSTRIVSTDEGDKDDDSLKSKKLQELPVTAGPVPYQENHRLQSSPSIHNPADTYSTKSRVG